MNTSYIFLCILLIHISFSNCAIPPCKTNCSDDEECWQNALGYHSAELIEQLFSFSSLAVHVDKYQRSHSSEVNDTITFIDQTLEDNLSNELVNSSLRIDLFIGTKEILIEFCKNLTIDPVEAVDQLPPLICSLSTCNSDMMNFLTIFIISIVSTSCIALLCFCQSFKTYRQTKLRLTLPKSISFSARDSDININSYRF